jgi:alpha-N-acetylglucosaminidase
MYGGLTQIAENFEKVLSSPEKGNLSGMGLIMEGLDYNPVIYEFVTDMMWETGVPDLEKWKIKYLKSRYGMINKDVLNGWEYLFKYYYTKGGIFERNPINSRPKLVEKDLWPSKQAVLGANLLIGSSVELKNCDAYKFDVVNLFRQVFGQYAGHLLFEITSGYQERDIKKFDESVTKFMTLSLKLEKLMATRKEFLLGKWISDSRERATNANEEKRYEWNAKAIITTWGGRELYGYALKDWAGMYTSYYLPKWQKFFASMRSELTEGKKLNYKQFVNDIMLWEDNWNNLKEENISSIPTGNSIQMAKELWNEYGEILLSHQISDSKIQ